MVSAKKLCTSHGRLRADTFGSRPSSNGVWPWLGCHTGTGATASAVSWTATSAGGPEEVRVTLVRGDLAVLLSAAASGTGGDWLVAAACSVFVPFCVAPEAGTAPSPDPRPAALGAGPRLLGPLCVSALSTEARVEAERCWTADPRPRPGSALAVLGRGRCRLAAGWTLVSAATGGASSSGGCARARSACIFTILLLHSRSIFFMDRPTSLICRACASSCSCCLRINSAISSTCLIDAASLCWLRSLPSSDRCTCTISRKSLIAASLLASVDRSSSTCRCKDCN
mmetsp:Transcript_41304/g.99099  ORF Transcript_41304/g.99099 Transcript_41304/m.99099 type:complete len:284 (-) Transcript_41304:637-1488(-)